MKKVICWGGDCRMKILAGQLCSLGLDGQWVPGTALPIWANTVDEYILPTPTIDKNDCLTGTDGNVHESDVLAMLPSGCRAAAYLSEERAKAWRSTRPDIRLVLMNREENYLDENGRISAEGAMFLAGGKGKCLFSAKCIVLGYGHMGRALCNMLRGIGADVIAVGRIGGSLDRAAMDDIDFCDLNTWQNLLPEANWIFNTIPQPLMGERELCMLRSDCRLMELASPPYGIDAAAAKKLGLSYQLEPSIPGRLYPVSAAEAMLSCWHRITKPKEGENES